jgi:hypothetical protein
MLTYFLFKDKGITPGEFYKMPIGEKLLITAFMRQMYFPADETQKRIIPGGEEE